MDENYNHGTCITLNNIDTMSNEEFKSSLLDLIHVKYPEAESVTVRYCKCPDVSKSEIYIEVNY
jgi:hypothetical protein